MSDILSDVNESFEDFQFNSEPEDTEAVETEETTEETTEESPENTEEPTENDETNDDNKEETSEPEKEEKPKKTNRLQKRFKHFKNEISSRDSEIAKLRNELESVKKQYGMVDDDGLPVAPDPKNYKSEREYRDDWFKWENTVKQIKGDRETKQRIDFDNKVKSFQESMKEEKLKWNDFDDVVTEEFLNQPAQPHIQEAIMSAPNGTDILYALGKTPDLLFQLNNMSESKALMLIGQISEQVKSFVSKNRNKGKVSKAKKVPSTVAGKTTANKSPDNMTMDEYVEWRSKQN